MATDRQSLGRWPLLLALALAAALALFAWQQRSERQEAEQTLGLDAARVVREQFTGKAEMKVATLSGTVVARGDDKRFFDLLKSNQTMKAPFSVDYFVDLSRTGPRAYRFDEQARTVTIDIPDVVPADPNIDETKAVVEQEGLIITRDAAVNIARQASERAAAKTGQAAASSEYMNQAREHARAAIATIAANSLAAAGLDDVRVAVSFPWEPKGRISSSERWDESRRVEDVLNERKSQQR